MELKETKIEKILELQRGYDLPAEKIIYGKDFIYTKDIERFSDIVAMYLKKIIKN